MELLTDSSVKSQSASFTQFKIGWKGVRSSLEMLEFLSLYAEVCVRLIRALGLADRGETRNGSGLRQAGLVKPLDIFDCDGDFTCESSVTPLIFNFCG